MRISKRRMMTDYQNESIVPVPSCPPVGFPQKFKECKKVSKEWESSNKYDKKGKYYKVQFDGTWAGDGEIQTLKN